MAFWGWSRTPASNGTADPTINMAEGMSPSAVNDGVRALMSRLRDFGDDISGAIATGGTSTAYTITSNQVFDTLAHMNGQMIAFVPHATNGAIVTLNVDGLGAKPLRSAPSTDIGAGVLVQGSPYVATYNNSDAAFYLHNFYGNPFNIPIGGLMVYLGASAPNSNFVLPFGQSISRTTYATLFALIGTTFGTGDGSTTFTLPDLRNLAIFGLGNMGGSDRGLITVAGGNFNGAVLGAGGGAQNHTMSVSEMPSHNHGGATGSHSHGLSTLLTSATTAQFTSGAGNVAIISGSTSNSTDAATATISSQGGGAAFAIMPPSVALPYIVRVI